MERSNLRHVKKQEDKPLEASKWLDLPVLLSGNEMTHLIHSLENVHLYSISRTLTELNTPEDFLEGYAKYVHTLEKGLQPKALDAYLLSNSADALYASQITEEKFLVRAHLPAVFIRPHSFIFSALDKKFRSKVYGEHAITWGYTFSYPQYCIDPNTHDAEKVDERYTNTALFKQVQKWIRDKTVPTPFLHEESKVNAPIRIGKECLKWINRHPQLQSQKLHVPA